MWKNLRSAIPRSMNMENLRSAIPYVQILNLEQTDSWNFERGMVPDGGRGLDSTSGYFYWMVEPALCDFHFSGGHLRKWIRRPAKENFRWIQLNSLHALGRSCCERVVLSIMPPRLWLVYMDHSVWKQERANKSMGMEIASRPAAPGAPRDRAKESPRGIGGQWGKYAPRIQEPCTHVVAPHTVGCPPPCWGDTGPLDPNRCSSAALLGLSHGVFPRNRKLSEADSVAE